MTVTLGMTARCLMMAGREGVRKGNEEKQKRKETVKDNGFGCSINIFDIYFDIRSY